jgi:hypothetical protein
VAGRRALASGASMALVNRMARSPDVAAVPHFEAQLATLVESSQPGDGWLDE